MLTVIIICSIFVIVATVLPMSKEEHWVVRGMDFPRFQLLILSAILLVLILIFMEMMSTLSLALFSVIAICFIWQLWWILPYTPFWTKEVKSSENSNPERNISIITSNVLKTNRKSAKLIELVKEHQPDILVTLESDNWWEEQLKVLEADMPHTVKCPLDNLYGMHLYSRLKLHNYEISYLVERGVPSIHAQVELRTGDKIRAHFIHPAPPSPSENEESSERDAELIIVARSFDKSKPVLVTGDLNDVAWSSTTRLFRKISGLLDPRIGRGMFNTFHAKYPLLRWPLDHLFHSDHFKLNFIRRLPAIGSDHFPLMTSLSFIPEKENNKQGIKADAEDSKRATEITDKKDVDETDVPEPDKK